MAAASSDVTNEGVPYAPHRPRGGRGPPPCGGHTSARRPRRSPTGFAKPSRHARPAPTQRCERLGAQLSTQRERAQAAWPRAGHQRHCASTPPEAAWATNGGLRGPPRLGWPEADSSARGTSEDAPRGHMRPGGDLGGRRPHWLGARHTSINAPEGGSGGQRPLAWQPHAAARHRARAKAS
jgi:hypothetical protein